MTHTSAAKPQAALSTADPASAAAEPATASTPSPLAAPAANVAAGPSLTDRATSGFIYFAAQAAAFKGVSILAHVTLAYLLTRADFGLFALCLTVAAFVELLQHGGLREVLVRRQSSFRVWANATFWMSLALGMLGGTVLAASGPVMAAFYGDARLIGLLALLAVASPLASLNTVPMARLQIQLRFRLLAAVAAVVNISQLILTVVLAALDFGAYSFVIPRVLMPIVQAAIIWPAAGFSPQRRLHWRRWPLLFTDGALLVGALLLYTIVAQGDRIILGRWTDPETVGIYAFALFLSLQTMQAITQNLEQIFFPTLSAIQRDSSRQIAAYIRASRVLALIAVPACLFQAALADPLIRLVFQPKWHPAIPVAEILSLGMLFLAITTPAFSLLRAQGRFATLCRLAAACAAGFVIILLTAAWTAGQDNTLLGVAVAVAAYHAVSGITHLLLATRPATLTTAASTIAHVLLLPALTGVLTIGAAWLLANAWPGTARNHILRMLIIVAVGAPAYLLAARIVMPETWSEFLSRVQALRAAIARRVAPSHPPSAPQPAAGA